jgi:hypothetical protein
MLELFRTVCLASYAALGVLLMLYGTDGDVDRVAWAVLGYVYALGGCALLYFFFGDED